MSSITTDTNPNRIQNFIDRRIDKVLPGKDQLIKLLTSGKRLTIYQGFDPSSPNLHIGHLVGLLTLREFQRLGHRVIFLIGDFTATIGDPTGKLQARTVLDHDKVLENAQTYKDQAGLVLDFNPESKNPMQMKFNYDWNSQLKFADVLNIASHFTLQQLIERDMFQTRIKDNKEIFLNEFLYPLVQGYDSVAMEVDIEVGGSDQLFNMAAGRKLVKEILGKEKFVVTTPLLADSSGRKIGKTEGNAINLTNSPQEFFGQIMSLPDDAIMPCFKLITDLPSSELPELEKLTSSEPMQAKKKLAWTLLKMLQGEEAANLGQSHFENTFQKGQTPDNVLEFKITKPIDFATFTTTSNLLSSKSEARRLIDQGAVKLDGETINDPSYVLEVPNQEQILKIGKRKFVKLNS